MGDLVPEDLGHDGGESVEGEWLLQIVESSIGETLADNGVVGVAGHEDHLQIPVRGHKFICEVASVQARHYNVGQ